MKKVKLGDVCIIQSGGTPSKKETAFYGGNIPWITTVALNDGYIDECDAVEWITETAILKSAAKIVPANSIMVGTRVGIGKTSINKVPMSTNQDIVSLLKIDENKWDKCYISKFISEKKSFLNSQARGATIKGIRIETLKSLELPYTPLEEQRRIASVLDKVNGLIDKRRRQMDRLDELVKSEFIEMFGDPIQMDKNEVLQKLGDVCTLKAGKFVKASDISASAFNNSYPCYGGNGIRGYVKDYNCNGCFPLIGRQGALCGNVQYATGKFRATEHAVVVTPKIKMDKYWLYFLLFLLNLNRYASGAAQPGLAVKRLEEIRVKIPDIKDQQKFSKIAYQSDKSKSEIKKSLEKLETLKKALMQKYFE